MLQEQEPVELPSNSPEPIPDHQSILSSYIIKLDQPRIQDHLIADYSAFRTKQAAQSLYKRTKDALSHSCAFALAVFKEAWREIGTLCLTQFLRWSGDTSITQLSPKRKLTMTKTAFSLKSTGRRKLGSS